MTHVRGATATDADLIAASLAAAFDDDPVISFLVPPDVADREARIRKFMGLGTRSALAAGTLWTTDDCTSAAVWKAPGHWKTPVRDIVLDTPTGISVFRRRLPLALSILSTVEKHHPSEPHWYLATLGTHPDRAGRGQATAVMAPVLERCDREGVPAYLESSKAQNVPFYERHGFRVTQELALPKGGPTLWLMWREPLG